MSSTSRIPSTQKITFATVDKRSSKWILRKEGIIIPEDKYIDMQEYLKYKGGHKRDEIGDLAKRLIDDSYIDLKTGFPKERNDFWEEKPMQSINLQHAARRAYVSYGLYKKMKVILYGQRHLLPDTSVAETICPYCHTR